MLQAAIVDNAYFDTMLSYVEMGWKSYSRRMRSIVI